MLKISLSVLNGDQIFQHDGGACNTSLSFTTLGLNKTVSIPQIFKKGKFCILLKNPIKH